MIFSERTFKDTEDPQMTTTDLESQNGDTGTSERNRRTQKHHKGLEWLQETKDPGLRKCLQRPQVLTKSISCAVSSYYKVYSIPSKV